MKRKVYQEPTMKVVRLEQQYHILAGSASGDVTATMNGTFDEEDI